MDLFPGKGNEDKRGLAVTYDVYNKSWLYVNGRPIISSRHMEVSLYSDTLFSHTNLITEIELTGILFFIVYIGNNVITLSFIG